MRCIDYAWGLVLYNSYSGQHLSWTCISSLSASLIRYLSEDNEASEKYRGIPSCARKTHLLVSGHCIVWTKKNVIWNRLNYTRGGFGVIIKASFKALFWICFNTELRLFILLWTVDTSENSMKATDSLFKEIRLYVNFGRQFRGIHLIQKAT